MASSRKLLHALLVLGSLASQSGQSANSAPYVYANAVTALSYDDCKNHAHLAIERNNFNVQTSGEQGSNGQKSAVIFAGNKLQTISLVVSCNGPLKLAAIGVAGDNNDETYTFFKKFYDDF